MATIISAAMKSATEQLSVKSVEMNNSYTMTNPVGTKTQLRQTNTIIFVYTTPTQNQGL